MVFFPAIVVFGLVFLFFSKEVLTTKEKHKEEKTTDAKPSISDVMLKYELLHGLKKES